MMKLLITEHLRMEFCGNEFPATVVLPSGEVLRDFRLRIAIGRILRKPQCARFLNSQLHYKLLSHPHHYVWLRLTRPYPEVCWLMRGTLFALPKSEWLEEF
jgi:hypothetical protein